MLAALDQHHKVVLAQRAVDAKTNEIPELKTLLSQVDLAGTIGTAGTQHDTGTWLAGQGAHYLFMRAGPPVTAAAVDMQPSGCLL
jgi:hypothetical protein